MRIEVQENLLSIPGTAHPGAHPVCVKFRVLGGKSRPCSHGSPGFLHGDYFRQNSASMEKQKQAKVLPGITLCPILVLVIFRVQLLAKTKGVDWGFSSGHSGCVSLYFNSLCATQSSVHMNCVCCFQPGHWAWGEGLPWPPQTSISAFSHLFSFGLGHKFLLGEEFSDRICAHSDLHIVRSRYLQEVPQCCL